MKRIAMLALAGALPALSAVRGPAATVMIEAEEFNDAGGWVIDQQFMDQMGSPFLLAHGMGVPVRDATTSAALPSPGEYRIFVRTRDWVAPWKAPGAPGRFQVLVDGRALETTFGAEGPDWHWQAGGTVKIAGSHAKIALHDLTGFDGRCDAIVLTSDEGFTPPAADPDLGAFRRKMLQLPETPPEAGQFDFVVAGGGIAGACAAVSAARLGLRVALIHDRPVLGGNNSSEVRVHLGGGIGQQPYPNLGKIVAELDSGHHGNAMPAEQYDDARKLAVARAERNLTMFLGWHLNGVEKKGDRIGAVVAQNIRTGERLRFTAPVFADCTGDGTLGFLAGADFRMGREGKDETEEGLAPEKKDAMTMGTSVMWYALTNAAPSSFPGTPWAVQFNEQTCQKLTRGDWDWETGMDLHQVDDFERVRDYGFRVVFGNWSFLKNQSKDKAKYANLALAWVAFVGGKRESRRLMGDVVLKQQDVEGQVAYPDASVTTTWTIDLHYPKAVQGFEGEAFRSVAKHAKIKPYAIPYRCLYSRNVPNLFMAGRNISVTHVALGTVRVMRTCGMMGEVAGMAASLCKQHDALPRDVYEKHLEELKALMTKGAPDAGTAPR